MYPARTGQARLGHRPSKKSIKTVVDTVHALTAGNGVGDRGPGRLHFSDHRQDVGGEVVRRGPQGLAGARACPVASARPGGLERGLDALRDHNPLVLRDGRENAQRQPVGVRVVDGDELDAGVHQGGDEGEIAPVWQ